MNPTIGKILFVLLSALFISTVLAHHSSDSMNQNVHIETFEQFKEHFHKEYSSDEEEQLARQNFENSKQWIAENKHRVDFDVGITSMADEITFDIDSMEVDQFPHHERDSHDHHEGLTIPKHFDWREHITMSPVISQGKCGSCWAFVAAIMTEANLAIHKNLTVVLSKQELIDCTIKVAKENMKCHGGHDTQAYSYIHQYGIHLEQDYPLLNRLNVTDEFPCKTNLPGLKYHIKHPLMARHRSKDENLQALIMKYGPLSVRVFAHLPAFKLYRGGILKNIAPNPAHHTHAFIVLGWGHDSVQNMDYWLVRNSWGLHWGEQGYGRIQMGINSLGINDFASYLL